VKGIEMSVEHWRRTVLGYLREHILFIGMWSEGAFIIIDKDDARAAQDYLEDQIKELEQRIADLKHQAEMARRL
jgi:tellurite resistance protein